MKMQVWAVGKRHEPYVREGVEDFTGRLRHYFPLEWHIIPVPKHAGMLSAADLKAAEGRTILEWLRPEDHLVALDEQGVQMDSEGLASFLGARAGGGSKRVVFLIGGAFGIDASVLKRADTVWSLSRLTFPHQLVRLILAEQLYRACTILRHEKYHHR
jgi:23S rRNA (pseudouridine1915-N3)-methyltransferase